MGGHSYKLDELGCILILLFVLYLMQWCGGYFSLHFCLESRLMVRNAIKIIHRLIKMSLDTDKCKISISLTGDEMAVIGKSITFHCMCPDNNTTINWMLNNNKINISNTRYNTTSNKLTILKVRSSDRGSYSCELNSEESVSLTVEGKYFYILYTRT